MNSRFYALTLFALSFALTFSGNDSLLADEDAWGHLSGQILVEGDLPSIATETVDKDQATCMVDGKAPKDDNIVVSDDMELRDVFVMMYFKKGDDVRPAVHPSYAAEKEKPVELDNKQCRFEPHAVFLQTGQAFKLKNSDDVGHNCRIVCMNNEENINLSPNNSVEIKLKNTEKIPGNILCDMHKWMDAVVLVRDEPYVGISADDGKFQIENIPAGTWKFQFWHKKTGYMRDLAIPGHKVGRRGEIEVTIKKGETLDLGKLVFPTKKFKK